VPAFLGPGGDRTDNDRDDDFDPEAEGADDDGDA
jgi:hypothetical protein